jgi:hypothetical protein
MESTQAEQAKPADPGRQKVSLPSSLCLLWMEWQHGFSAKRRTEQKSILFFGFWDG